VPFINTQGLILIGPGSEWFWNAVSGLILAGTFIAVYRQLRLQANATATGQLTEFEREWTSERLRRFQLAVLRELQAGVDPASLSGGPPHVVFDFWERIGALALRGRVDTRLLASVNLGVSEWWWTVLKAWVLRRRIEIGPTFGEGFEWLNSVASKINRETGTLGFDEVGDLAAEIAALERVIRIEEELRAAPGAASQGSSRRTSTPRPVSVD
jgi:hypothetical protein